MDINKIHNFLQRIALYSMRLSLILLFLSFLKTESCYAEKRMRMQIPLIGAQVIIEKGQTPQEIETFFQRLHENRMNICRIRMFEAYMHKSDGSWDFSLFDTAFRSAEKYNIKIFATLFPATSFSDIGGFKFPQDEIHFANVKEYIRHVVCHFKKFSSLYGWVLVNEPGVSGKIPPGTFTSNHFENWKLQHKQIHSSLKYPVLDFNQEKFLLDYNTWYLKRLSEEVRKYDVTSEIHVNNHNIFRNVAEYDFPSWSKFLTSLGGSAHASWHFSYFNRSQYAVAMSLNSEIIRSGAQHIPWIMTEMQGGNNTYSGDNAMCPTPEEIQQWLWIVIGTEAKGAIFWSLNARASGLESGEWALLDFQNNPSKRLTAAESVAKTIQQNEKLFCNASVAESGISILYTRESMWIEKKMILQNSQLSGRQCGGVMKSAIGYFEALSEMGIQCNFKSIDEFDFSKDNYLGKTLILANQISIPQKYWKSLENFVLKGGTLWIDGLSGYYDENAICTFMTDSTPTDLFGGNQKEYILVDNIFDLNLSAIGINLPAHAWKGIIDNIDKKSTQILGTDDEEITAITHYSGKGKTIWIPSLLGLGGRIEGYKPLQSLLNNILRDNLKNSPIRFSKTVPETLMKVMKNGDNFISIIINKNKNKQNIELTLDKPLKPHILFANKNGNIIKNKVSISPEESIVILWK